ncbi:glycosyltransferase family 9 protein [Psychroserpens sp. XS_ASV72]|uniref:glycosyltransferase family 9 protein n=1 Tax=Psychroserpens sp. XS_ASV72 TaxID=3241293 RepID=UPI0035162C7E
MKVLIIQQKMIGDVLTSSIIFEALKREHPKSELHYVINSHTYAVVENNPFIDKFIFVTPEIENNRAKFLTFLKSIRKEHYDAVIDVYSKFSSNLMTKFSKAAIKISKYKWYTKYYYTHTFKEASKPHTNAGLAIENRLQMLAPLVPKVPEPIRPKIYLTEEEIELSKQLLITNNIDISRPLYMISVLGSGDNKTYPLPHMAKVIDFIVEQTSGQILFNYIPNQIHEAKTVYNFCSPETRPHIFFDVFGKNLREFLALTYHCNALIGNEGGAVNMAKALNVPTFTIFSPWIIKEAWSMFEDGKQNISVHLKDYNPEIIDKSSKKELKDNYKTLYEMIEPTLFFKPLKRFLEIN